MDLILTTSFDRGPESTLHTQLNSFHSDKQTKKPYLPQKCKWALQTLFACCHDFKQHRKMGSSFDQIYILSWRCDHLFSNPKCKMLDSSVQCSTDSSGVWKPSAPFKLHIDLNLCIKHTPTHFFFFFLTIPPRHNYFFVVFLSSGKQEMHLLALLVIESFHDFSLPTKRDNCEVTW